MANIPQTKVENNFTQGLKTEFTGLNFPENAATDTDNCVFTLIGDVTRRSGIDYETNLTQNTINRTGNAISTYKWNNVGGDGSTQIVVEQVGTTLYFFRSSSATIVNPLSSQKLASTVDLTPFIVTGNTNTNTFECQFTDGNGYLFVFHPYIEPFYCTYSAGTITATKITLRIRDFNGIIEPGVADNLRPSSLTIEHNYNLRNQGWTSGSPWNASSSTLNTYSLGSHTWTVSSSTLPISGGQIINVVGSDAVRAPGQSFALSGTVTSYVGTTLTLNVNSLSDPLSTGAQLDTWTFTTANVGFITTWFNTAGNFPSNADVWWQFKNTSNAFDPATTISNVTLNSGPAPKGFYILNAFNQQRSLVSGVASITDVTTTIRPKTGTWFQGRVWYTGVDASFTATGDAPYSTWTENIYFSQIVNNTSQFGNCFQINDPTSETLFDLLATDGGVIQIQGCGSIYKLFPIQNGMLVFAANGIWFITGSQGIGFSANDYTITKISGIQSISSTSFVTVMGYPLFWNEEGIYSVSPSQSGALSVENLCIGTILSFYANIPVSSKKYVKGDYNPLDYVVQWTYRSTEATDVTTRYEYNRMLNFNVHNKAFFPYTVSGTPKVNGIIYVASPGGSTAPDPVFKYLASRPSSSTYQLSFAEEHDDTHFVDWFQQDSIGVNYTSYFIAGYKLHGQALRKFQPEYIYMYSRNDVNTAYKLQGIWDYAINRNSGKFSSIEVRTITDDPTHFSSVVRKHRVRGHGLVLQFKVISVDGKQFDVMGWSIWENINQGI